MDINFSEAELAFRDEVRAFLKDAWNEELASQAKQPGSYKDVQVAWERKLNSKGWAAPLWPVEYGGAG